MKCPDENVLVLIFVIKFIFSHLSRVNYLEYPVASARIFSRALRHCRLDLFKWLVEVFLNLLTAERKIQPEKRRQKRDVSGTVFLLDILLPWDKRSEKWPYK